MLRLSRYWSLGRAPKPTLADNMSGFDNRLRVERYGAAMIGYSQGAIFTGECWEYDIKADGGRLNWAKDHMLKAVTFATRCGRKAKHIPIPVRRWSARTVTASPTGQGDAAASDDRGR
jgi:hypothetical protein